MGIKPDMRRPAIRRVLMGIFRIIRLLEKIWESQQLSIASSVNY
jgi:hypothetical protein